MTKELFKSALLICTGIVFLLPVAIISQEAERRNNGHTKLRVLVTGGRQAVPVNGADVFVRSNAGDEEFQATVKTGAQGVANVSGVPYGTVLIQVTAKGWQNSGGQHELNKQEQTITITLNEVEEQKPSPSPSPTPTPPF